MEFFKDKGFNLMSSNDKHRPFFIEEVEIVQVDPIAHVVYAKGREGGRRWCSVLSSTPVDRAVGAASLSLPEVGTRGLAVAIGEVYYTLGWYSPLNSRGHTFGVESLPHQEVGDIVWKTTARTFLSLGITGLTRIFSDSWAFIELSKTLQKFKMLVKRAYVRTRGGKVSWKANADTDVTDLHIEIHDRYEQDHLGDGSLDREEVNSNLFDPTINLTNAKYVDKVLFDAAGTRDDRRMLHLETRQSSLGTKNKDQFTSDSRGWQINGIALKREAEDTVRGFSFAEILGEQDDGTRYDFELNNTLTLDSVRNSIGDLGGGDLYSSSFERTGQITRTHVFGLNRDDDRYEELKIVDAAGIEVFRLTVSADKKLTLYSSSDITVHAGTGGTIRIGDGSESVTSNADGVLTPNTIFGGSVKQDTFTGAPFVGSTKVGSS